MTLKWADKGKAVEVNPQLYLPQFSLASAIQTIECVSKYMLGNVLV